MTNWQLQQRASSTLLHYSLEHRAVLQKTPNTVPSMKSHIYSLCSSVNFLTRHKNEIRFVCLSLFLEGRRGKAVRKGDKQLLAKALLGQVHHCLLSSLVPFAYLRDLGVLQKPGQ